eukprot:gene469-1875_t
MEGSGLVRDDGAVKNADLSWEEIQELGEAKAKTKRASTVAAYESRLRKIKSGQPESRTQLPDPSVNAIPEDQPVRTPSTMSERTPARDPPSRSDSGASTGTSGTPGKPVGDLSSKRTPRAGSFLNCSRHSSVVVPDFGNYPKAFKQSPPSLVPYRSDTRSDSGASTGTSGTPGKPVGDLSSKRTPRAGSFLNCSRHSSVVVPDFGNYPKAFKQSPIIIILLVAVLVLGLGLGLGIGLGLQKADSSVSDGTVVIVQPPNTTFIYIIENEADSNSAIAIAIVSSGVIDKAVAVDQAAQIIKASDSKDEATFINIFSAYVKKFDKKYADDDEALAAYAAFVENIQDMANVNTLSTNQFIAGLNKYSDVSKETVAKSILMTVDPLSGEPDDDEGAAPNSEDPAAVRRRLLDPLSGEPDDDGEEEGAAPNNEDPAAVRRRLLDTVPEVVDHRATVAASSAVESAALLLDAAIPNVDLALSVQHIVDCATFENGYRQTFGCAGGTAPDALDFAADCTHLTHQG